MNTTINNITSFAEKGPVIPTNPIGQEGFLDAGIFFSYKQEIKVEDLSEAMNSGRINRYTGTEFSGSQSVSFNTFPAGYKFTLFHLMKNDLNGLYLTDQPGQPFNRDPGNRAGFEVLINLIRNLVVQNGNGTQNKSI